MGRKEALLFICLVGLFIGMEKIDIKYGLVPWINSLREEFRWVLYFCIILGILNLGATNELPFIYFQF